MAPKNLRATVSHNYTQAYSKSLTRYRGETTLPNQDLSSQQLFFRSYAQVGSCCLLPQLASHEISTYYSCSKEPFFSHVLSSKTTNLLLWSFSLSPFRPSFKLLSALLPNSVLLQSKKKTLLPCPSPLDNPDFFHAHLLESNLPWALYHISPLRPHSQMRSQPDINPFKYLGSLDRQAANLHQV